MKTKTNQLITLAGLLLLTGSFVNAQTTWTGAIDDDIGNSLNWTNGLSSSTNFGALDNGDTVEMEDRSDLTNRYITVSGGSTIHLVQLASNPGFRWGNSVINLNSGGNLDSDYSTGGVQMGRGGEATLNMYSGSTANFLAGLNVGRDSKATVNQFGGSMVIGGLLAVPENSSASVGGSRYNLSGGTVTANSLLVDAKSSGTNWFNFTTGSTGSLTIMDDTVDYFNDFITDGDIRINNLSALVTDFTIDTSVGGQTTISVIPEPGSIVLLGLGMASVIITLRRRR